MAITVAFALPFVIFSGQSDFSLVTNLTGGVANTMVGIILPRYSCASSFCVCVCVLSQLVQGEKVPVMTHALCDLFVLVQRHLHEALDTHPRTECNTWAVDYSCFGQLCCWCSRRGNRNTINLCHSSAAIIVADGTTICDDHGRWTLCSDTCNHFESNGFAEFVYMYNNK